MFYNRKTGIIKGKFWKTFSENDIRKKKRTILPERGEDTMRNTSTDLRRQTMYSVFVRNHTEEGTFAALEKDLDRIRALGTDVIWLMPIHPIGQKERKGDLKSLCNCGLPQDQPGIRHDGGF